MPLCVALIKFGLYVEGEGPLSPLSAASSVGVFRGLAEKVKAGLEVKLAIEFIFILNFC